MFAFGTHYVTSSRNIISLLCYCCDIFLHCVSSWRLSVYSICCLAVQRPVSELSFIVLMSVSV